MKLSKFGKKIARGSGIGQLMDDLGDALLPGRTVKMLGGGNPAHIPQVQRLFRESMRDILEKDGEFEQMIGNYDSPQGNIAFIEALADLLRNRLHWDISPANIALTNGSQTAFFILFNMFAGEFDDGARKKILLPLAPEYIGYDDVGLIDDFFIAGRPEISHLPERLFKYHVNFDALSSNIDFNDIGALCVSRPTNPTGNVLTDNEIGRLHELTVRNDIPFILDNAYGTPFPQVIFTDVKPFWSPNTILCMSLSKLGLPATRTGIVIAEEPVIEAISAINAVLGLAPTSIGAALATRLVQTGEIISISHDIIRPFYENKARETLDVARRELDGLDYSIHVPEGAFFIWIWFHNLSVTSEELYRRLKQRGVLVLPGHYFFPGLTEPWEHKQQCLRVTYAQQQTIVNEGLRIIGEEARKASETGPT